MAISKERGVNDSFFMEATLGIVFLRVLEAFFTFRYKRLT